MSNEYIINQAIKLYFQGKDWRGYLKKRVKESEKFKNALKNLIQEEKI